MKLLRSDRLAALLILASAVIGFALANSDAAEAFMKLAHTKITIGKVLEVEAWISELGLAFFFLLIGIELRHEFTHGAFKQRRNAIPPLVAALFGVAAPAALYAIVNLGDQQAIRGWAIPTATDVTFAMAIFLLFGNKLPSKARTFLLTIVVADDLIAIVIIAVVFQTGFNLPNLVLALICAFIFWLTFRAPIKSRLLRLGLGIVLGLATWYFFLTSGIHPVIAGVLLGLLLPDRSGKRTAEAILIPTNLAILPLFAAFSAAVSLSSVGLFNGIFFGIMLGPIGKIVGIALGGWLGYQLIRAKVSERLSLADLARLGALGGIGFTVSLLVAQLSFKGDSAATSQAIFAVLVASVLTMIIGSFALATAKRT